MGTATAAFKGSGTGTIKTLQRMIRTTKNPKRKSQLAKKLGRVINKVILKDPALAGVRSTLLSAVADEVNKQIVTKFARWEAGGSKPAKWPFKPR